MPEPVRAFFMFDLLPAYLKILSHHTAKDMITPIFLLFHRGNHSENPQNKNCAEYR
jgi:hypothetical protein